MININEKEYLDKVNGCWLGKAIGGTLGMPMEWKRQWNDVTYYLQSADELPAPNDDLDLQIISLAALEDNGPGLTPSRLAEYFLQFVTPFWAEYGAAKSHLLCGVLPPYSGMTNNVFKDSCGCFIRSELWACIAPGFPAQSVVYAAGDGSIDHGSGEGVYAECFCAAVQSAAFVERNIPELIRIGLTYIPPDSACSRAVKLAEQLFAAGKPLKEARIDMLKTFCSGYHIAVDGESVRLGLDKGTVGTEAPTNLGMIALALYYGQGDFEKSLLAAVACGEDTDCTAGTVAALFGILLGASGLPEKWKAPIGDRIVSMCVALGDFPMPRTVGEMSARVEAVMRQVALAKSLPLTVGEGPTDTGEAKASLTYCGDLRELYLRTEGVYYDFGLFEAYVVYPDGVYAAAEEVRRVKILLSSKSALTANVTARLVCCGQPQTCAYGPEEQTVYLGRAYPGLYDPAHRMDRAELQFEIRPQTACALDFVVVLKVSGRAETHCIPVRFLV